MKTQVTFVKMCGSCARGFAGPVNFCPFCGKPPAQERAQTIPPLPLEITGSKTTFTYNQKIEEPKKTVESLQPATQEKPEIVAEPSPIADSVPSSETEKQSPFKKTSKNSVQGTENVNLHHESCVQSPLKPQKLVFRKGAVIVVTVVLLLATVAIIFFKKGQPATISEVAVDSSPVGALVTVDGSPAGKTPFVLKGITVGKHILEFSMKGREQTSLVVELKKGKNLDIQTKLPRQDAVKIQKNPVTETIPSAQLQKPSAQSQDKPKDTIVENSNSKPMNKIVDKSKGTSTDEKIQDAINLYDSQRYEEAASKFKEVLEVVPNNALAKFYLKRSLEAGK